MVCIGRNYVDHIKELNNPVPVEPLLFMKPATAIQALDKQIKLPDYSTDCQHEVELSVLINSKLQNANQQAAERGISGYGIALDLTLRDIQQKLKKQGHPWERAKSFDSSAPLSSFIKKEEVADAQNIELELKINGSSRQKSNSEFMITPIFALVSYISKLFTLLPGDVVLTGTPAGVGQLFSGDQLELIFNHQHIFHTNVK